MKKTTYKKDEKNLIRITRDGDNETIDYIPIYNEDGTYNPELVKIMRTEMAKDAVLGILGMEPIKDEEIEPEPEAEFEFQSIDNEIQTTEETEEEKNEVVAITEGKKGWLDKAITFLAGGITVAAIMLACKSCGHEKTQDADNLTNNNNTNIESTIDNDSENTKEEEIPTIDELKSESRYTEITDELLASTTQSLIQEFADHNIEIAAEDALTFVAVANITHLENTNPELLTKVLGENADSETVLSKVGHVIGQIITLEVTEKDEQVDWTIAFIDETDKKIANHGIVNVIEASKLVASQNDLNEKEKSESIQQIIQINFVKPNYDKTVGYTFENGEYTSLSQEDGADFINDAIITSILFGDNVLKNYVYGSETQDDLKVINHNEDCVSNLMRIIEDCQVKTMVR